MSRIRIPEDTGEGFRFADGYAVFPRKTIEKYGIEFLRYLCPHSTILAAEDLLPSVPDGPGADETPGGQP